MWHETKPNQIRKTQNNLIGHLMIRKGKNNQLTNLILLFFHIFILLFASVVESDQKAPFSVATTPRCREGCYSFPWIATHYPWYLIMLSVKQGGIKYHFLSLWYDSTWDWTPVSQVISEHSTHKTNELGF